MKTLNELYHENRAKLEEIRESDPLLSDPLLMELDAYYRQPVKLLIIGQQTNGWHGNYKIFNVGGKRTDTGRKYYNSPFWNIARKIENILGDEPYSCAWSNINRYDHNCKEPKGVILEKIQELDFLLKEEIALIKPDVCMFFTNKKYDYRLERLFPGLTMQTIEGLPREHFALLGHELLPKYSFRTPHPKTIRIQNWEHDFVHAMQELLSKQKDLKA